MMWYQTSHALLLLFVIFTMKLQLKQNFHIATVLLYYIWLTNVAFFFQDLLLYVSLR